MNSKFFPPPASGEENDDNIFSKVLTGMKSVFNNPSLFKSKKNEGDIPTGSTETGPLATQETAPIIPISNEVIIPIEAAMSGIDSKEEPENNLEVPNSNELTDEALLAVDTEIANESIDVYDELPDFVKSAMIDEENDKIDEIIEDEVAVDVYNGEGGANNDDIHEESKNLEEEEVVDTVDEGIIVNLESIVLYDVNTEEAFQKIEETAEVEESVEEQSTPTKLHKSKNVQKKKSRKKSKVKDGESSKSEEAVEDLNASPNSKWVEELEGVEPKPRIVLTFRSEKTGSRSTNMKIVSDLDKKIEDNSAVTTTRHLRSKIGFGKVETSVDESKKEKRKKGSPNPMEFDSESSIAKSGNASEAEDCPKTPTLQRKHKRTANPSDSNSEDSPPVNKERNTVKRSARRRSKDFCDNVLANAMARKEKFYESANTTPTRLSRRIKPTAKVLANRELRLGFETQNNARLALQSEKATEEVKLTRSRLRRSPDKNRLETSPSKCLPEVVRTRRRLKPYSVYDKVVSSDEEKAELIPSECKLTVAEINRCILGSEEIKPVVEEQEVEEDTAEETEVDKETKRLNRLKKKHLRKLGLQAVVVGKCKKSAGLLREVVTDESTMDSTNTEAIIEHFNSRNKIEDASLEPEEEEETIPTEIDGETSAVDALNTQCDLTEDTELHITAKRKSSIEPATFKISEDSNQDDDSNRRVTRKRARTDNSLSSDPDNIPLSKIASEIQMHEDTDEELTGEAPPSTNFLSCMCTVDSNVYLDPNYVGEVEFCRAIDSVGGRSIGCGRVASAEGSMVRSGVRGPYLLPCDIHRKRMALHHCCAGCGVFCTQGTFFQCSLGHLFHWECGLPFVPLLIPPLVEGLLSPPAPPNQPRHSYSDLYDPQPGCPHCGLDNDSLDPVNMDCDKVSLDIKCTNPTILLPNPRLEWIPARMSVPSSRAVSAGTSVVSLPLPASSVPMFPSELLPVLVSGVARITASQQNQDYEEMLSSTRGEEKTERELVDAICDRHNTIERICTAISTGADPRKPIPEADDGSGLHLSAREFNLCAVHLFRSMHCDLDGLDKKRRTPIMVAIISYDHKIQDNIENKNKPEYVSVMNQYEKDFFSVLNYLVKAGANVTIRGPEGVTALHLAAKNGNVAACSLILESHTFSPGFINQKDDGGWTPLVWAAENGNYNVVKYLLRNSADPMVRDSESNVALHWAALVGCCDSIKVLSEHGCDVNAVNGHGDSPLHVSARLDHYNAVIILLARGGKIDLKNGNGETPIDCVGDENSPCYSALSINAHVKSIVRSLGRHERIVLVDISNGKENSPVQCVNAVDECDSLGDFTYVTENCFTTDVHIDNKISTMEPCKCLVVCGSSGSECPCSSVSVQTWYGPDGRLVPHFDYRDPPMIFECNDVCSCNKSQCLNRCLGSQRPWSSLVVFRKAGGGDAVLSRAGGWGVRTACPLARGSLVTEYVGEVLEAHAAYRRHEDAYLFELDVKEDVLEECSETFCLDANSYGNVSRFLNHKCEPNLTPVRVYVQHRDLRFPRIAFFACRDIAAGEELGFDYGEKFWVVKRKSLTCNCGSTYCRHSGEMDQAKDTSKVATQH